MLLFTIQVFNFQGADTLNLSFLDAKKILNENNLDIASARFHLKSGEADITGAYLRPNPNLSVTGTYLGFKDHKIDFDQSQNSIRLGQKFEIGGKLSDRVEVAKNNLKASTEDFNSFVFNLNNDFKSTFISYAYALKQYELSLKNEEFFKRLVEISKVRFANGDIGKLDVTSIELEQFNVTKDLSDAKQNLADLDSKIHLMLNLPPDKPIKVISDLLPEFTDFGKDSLINYAVNFRPDLISQKYRQIITQKKISLAYANSYPDLDVGVEYDFQGPDYKSAFGIGISFDLPLFNRNQDDIQRSKSEFNASTFEYQMKINSVKNEVLNAYEKYKSTLDFVKTLSSRQIDNAEEARNLSLKNFNSGNIGIIELIGSEQIYISSIKNFYDAFYKLYLNKINLEKSVGKELN